MATTVRAQVSLRSDTNLPEHAAVNVHHFRIHTGDTIDECESITTALTAFYQSVDAVLGSVLAGNATVQYYDLLDPQPRAPILVEEFTFSPASGDCFPNEVAIVLSVQGAPESGIPIARRRGRVYLGPISASAGLTGGGDTFLSTTARDTVANAGLGLATTHDPLHFSWVVFSPTIAGTQPWSSGELEAASTVITNGWCNNAFDTQRSRGLGDSARTLFDAS